MQRIEARLVIVRIRCIEDKRSEAVGLVHVGAAAERNLGQGGEGSGLTPAIPFRRGLGAHALHLLRDHRHVAEPPRCARRLVAPLERRLELERPQELLTGRAIGLTRERPASRGFQRIGRFAS